ncbi:MAG: transglutaminase domain-containing protein [Candidatus Bathyarchaeia archaeon]
MAETIGLKPFLSYPLENVENAYYWVSKNIRYMYDKERWGSIDYWQLPSTTIRLGTGDCEDQAILLVSLLRALRLPRENVRLAVSYTHRHAWVEVKLPLPVYGLEKVVAISLELLRNKRVTASIGDSLLERKITDSIIEEIKMAGLSHNNNWIPLDTTFVISEELGLPIPFSLWLAYGYNVYRIIFGLDIVPEVTFQDKARIWEINREIGTGGSISFEIPCITGDKILGIIKARSAEKAQILVSVEEVDVLARYAGPVDMKTGERLRVEWVADRSLTVYILNENDFKMWVDLYSWTCAGPPTYRVAKYGSSGFLEYIVPHPDKYYVVLYILHTILGGYPARVYSLTVKHIWQETTCNIQVSITEPQGVLITSLSILKRDVERRFEFTAERSGVYKVVLKNIGAPAPIYMRLDEFSTPVSLEIAGASGDLIRAEQEFLSEVARILGKIPTSIYISIEPREVMVGENVTIKGSINPSMDTTLTLLVTKPDGVTETLTVTSESNGSFAFNMKLDKEGIWTFIMSYPGDAFYETSQSIQIQVEVKTLLSKIWPYLAVAIMVIITAILVILRRRSI